MPKNRTLNKKMFNSSLKRSILFENLMRSDVKKVVKILEIEQNRLLAQTVFQLGQHSGGRRSSASIRVLKQKIEKLSYIAHKNFFKRTLIEADKVTKQIVRNENEYFAGFFKENSPDKKFDNIQPQAMKTVATVSPIQGKAFTYRRLNGGSWLTDLTLKESARFNQAILSGFYNGDDLATVVRAIKGTKAAGYADGIFAISRRHANTVTRTGYRFLQEETKKRIIKQVTDRVIYISVLDGRTTVLCADRDQRIYPINIAPGTDDHMGCRSTLSAYFGREGLVGNRYYTEDTRLPKQRRSDFLKEAKADSKGSWKNYSKARRKRLLDKKTIAWENKYTGKASIHSNFKDFFDQSGTKFQRQYLGEKRYRIYKERGLKLDNFITNDSKLKSIKNLNKQYRSVK